jgi:formyl-CoA transferase
MKHPYIQERELLVPTTTPDGQTLTIHAAPYRINGKRPPIRRAAPSIGQDNDKWLGQAEPKRNL